MRVLIITMLIACCLMAARESRGQNYPHYTMFMYNKLLYNPAYAGNKGLTTVNIYGRKQWSGIDGAPIGFTATIDGLLGNYMKPVRKVALGLSVNTEQIGVTKNTNLMGYYAYKIKVSENSVLSLGLQAGLSFYSANTGALNPYQQDDPLLNQAFNNVVLPNFGLGVYYTGKNYYAGLGVPNLIENYYNKSTSAASDQQGGGKQVRTYFLSGGYVFTVSPTVKIEPQIQARYAGNAKYYLPFNMDMNVLFFFYERFMVGATYRTDKSIEGIVFFQLTSNLCIGYSYDYTLSALRNYNSGTHELTIGFDFLRDRNKYINPRFIKLF